MKILYFNIFIKVPASQPINFFYITFQFMLNNHDHKRKNKTLCIQYEIISLYNFWALIVLIQ